MYDVFLERLRSIIPLCIPSRSITLGPRDPTFVTPFVKLLLQRRNALRRQGKINDANEFAKKIKRYYYQKSPYMHE